jgi:MFS family permease
MIVNNSNFSVMRHRNVSLALIGQLLASTAMNTQAVAVGFLLYKATGSTRDLGLLGLVEFLPVISLVFVTGPFADRRDRRSIAAYFIFFEAAISIALGLFLRTHTASPAPFLICALLFGLSRAFVGPASRSLLPAITPPDELEKALPLTSIAWQAAGIFGPLIGGVLADWIGWGVFMFAGAGFAIAATLFLLIPKQPPASTTKSAEKVRYSDAFAGLTLVFRHPVLFGAISLDLFAVLFGGAIALLPAIAKDILHTGGTGLGVLRVAAGAGGVVMGLILAVKPITKRIGSTLLYAVGAFGLFTIVLGYSRNFVLSWVALFALSAADMISVFIRTTLVPLATPDELRGRVLAVESVFIGASNELGAAESGFAAAAFGTVAAVVSGGIATIAIVAAWFVIFKPLARIHTFSEVRPESIELPDSAEPMRVT